MKPEDREYIHQLVRLERSRRMAELASARTRFAELAACAAQAQQHVRDHEAAVRRADATLEQLEAQK